MPRARHDLKPERKAKILERLRVGDCTASDLLKLLQQMPDSASLSRRAVNKYLLELTDEGKVQPLGFTKRTSTYRLLEGETDPVDALVMHSALRMLYHHTPGNAPRYFATLNRLAEQLPEPARSVARASTRDLKERKLTKADAGVALEVLAEAWFRGRVVQFGYKTHGGSGQVRKNLLEVYFIEINRANLGLYVIGMERSFHNAVRTYKIDRILKPQITETRYEMPEPKDFDPQKFLFNAWGVIGESGGGLVEVRLRFRPEVVPWVDELNYPGIKRTHNNPDKSLDVWLEVGTDSVKFPREVFSWIQGWGPRVEVLEPEGLRERWLEEARQVAAMGGAGGAVGTG